MENDKLLRSIISYLPNEVVSSLSDNTTYEPYKTQSSRKYFNDYPNDYQRGYNCAHCGRNRSLTGYNRMYQVGSDGSLDQIKSSLLDLAKNTQPGSYYNDIVVPVNIDEFRDNLLRMSNLARQDPDYRTKHGEKLATNLSGDKTAEGEIIYKSSQTPPYFVDLVINDKLNQAAQLQAEYLASSNNKGGTGKEILI